MYRSRFNQTGSEIWALDINECTGPLTNVQRSGFVTWVLRFALDHFQLFEQLTGGSRLVRKPLVHGFEYRPLDLFPLFQDMCACFNICARLSSC